MANVSVSRAEQETTIRFDQEKGPVSIFTASPVIRRKLERRGLTPYKISRMRGTPVGWFYQTPYRTLTWTIRGGKTPVIRGGSAPQNASGGLGLKPTNDKGFVTQPSPNYFRPVTMAELLTT